MDITNANLDIIFKQASLQYQEAFMGSETFWKEIAMQIPMGTRSTIFAMLDRLPQLKEWIGNRQINSAASLARAVVATPFEGTVALDKFDLEDDQLGLFSQTTRQLGESAAQWPDRLVADFVKTASVVVGYDGVPVYSTAHPILNGLAGGVPAGAPATQSNLFVNTALTFNNYVSVRSQMRSWVGSNGAPMGIQPSILMVPPALEGQAKLILESDFLSNISGTPSAGTLQSNTYKNSAKVLVNPWLADHPNNWWLLAAKSVMKPYAFHQRTAPKFTYLINPADQNVFLAHQFLYGVEARGAATETVWFLSAAGTSEADYIPA